MIRQFLRVPAIMLALRLFNENRKRIGQITFAHAVLWILDFSFDNILYPVVLVYFGNLLGGAMMTLAAGIICFGLVVYYERSGTDWLGVNVLEDVKERGDIWIGRFYSQKGHWWLLVKIAAFVPLKGFLLVLWLLKKNDVVAFFTLSIYEDAFKTTVFLRHGRFDGLKTKDWMIFFASLAVSNLYWIVRWNILIELFRMVF